MTKARRDYLSELIQQIQWAGFDKPQVEYRFHPVRRFRFDAAWVDKKVALEYEGGVYLHGKAGQKSRHLIN